MYEYCSDNNVIEVNLLMIDRCHKDICNRSLPFHTTQLQGPSITVILDSVTFGRFFLYNNTNVQGMSRQRQVYTEFNLGDYDNNSYQKVYDKSQNNPLSIIQEPDISYGERIHYLFINSGDRDITTYSNPNHYVVKFQQEFKNIKEIELINTIIPDKNNITQEPYLLLKIDEIQDAMISNNKYIAESFAFLALANPTTANGFITIDKRIHENTPKVFTVPKASLDKMTITITNHLGVPWNFGSDSGGPLKELQHTLIFRIVTLEKRRDSLGFRSVY